MSTELADPVVVEFDDRQPDPPRLRQAGHVVAYPADDLDEEGAVCTVCGYWGVVPARTDVLDALVRGSDRELVCQTCADETGVSES